MEKTTSSQSNQSSPTRPALSRLQAELERGERLVRQQSEFVRSVAVPRAQAEREYAETMMKTERAAVYEQASETPGAE